MNSRKEIKIRAFGSIMENSSENDFQCLVTFWKCYFSTNFSHFLSHFLSFHKKIILENFKIYTFNTTKNQNKNIFRTYTWYISGRRSKKEGEIEGTRDKSGKERSAWMEDGGGQIKWVWGWSGVGWWSMVARSVTLSKREKKSWGRREKKKGRQWGNAIWARLGLVGWRDLDSGATRYGR